MLRGSELGLQSELLYQELDFLMEVPGCSRQVVCSLYVGLLWGNAGLSCGRSLLSPRLLTP